MNSRTTSARRPYWSSWPLLRLRPRGCVRYQRIRHKVVAACKRERARRMHTIRPAQLAEGAKTDPSVLVNNDDMARAPA